MPYIYWLKDSERLSQYVEVRGKKVKACTECTFPHRPENYDKILQKLKEG